jgi:hypothetical protein
VSVATEGTANLSYDNISGVFTYTPPSLDGYLPLSGGTLTAPLYFEDGGITVGGIGTNGGRLSIGSGDVNLNFDAPANSIYPISDTVGTLSDGIVDIGASNARFKDLYLAGTATMDGLVVDGVAKVLGTAGNTFIIADATETNGYQLKANTSATADFGFLIENLAGKDLLKVESNNDISFYEDTGTTAKLFWDASAEFLGIGTTAPTVNGESLRLVNGLYLNGGGTKDVPAIGLGDTNSGLFGSTYVAVTTQGQERFRVDTGGNVGVGTDSPSAKLEVNGGGTATTGGTVVVRQDGDTNADGLALTSSNATSHRFWKDSGGKLNIGPSNLPSALVQDLAGNLLVGKTNTSSALTTAGIDLRPEGRSFMAQP